MTATAVNDWSWIDASWWHVTFISLWNSDQALSGTLNNSIWNWTGLTYLWLYHSDNLTWPIPSTINNLVNLTRLELNDNNLTGTIPDISALTSLTELELQGNNLNELFQILVLWVEV